MVLLPRIFSGSCGPPPFAELGERRRNPLFRTNVHVGPPPSPPISTTCGDQGSAGGLESRSHVRSSAVRTVSTWPLTYERRPLARKPCSTAPPAPPQRSRLTAAHHSVEFWRCSARAGDVGWLRTRAMRCRESLARARPDRTCPRRSRPWPRHTPAIFRPADDAYGGSDRDDPPLSSSSVSINRRRPNLGQMETGG